MKPGARPVLLLTAIAVSFSFAGITSARQDHDTAAIDTYIAQQARRERVEEYRDAGKVITGDLTHDGVPETVVLYTIEGQRGSNPYAQ